MGSTRLRPKRPKINVNVHRLIIMNKIGFPKPKMVEEDRIALIPGDLNMINYPNMLFFEKGYGIRHGFKDKEYADKGANIVNLKKAYSLEVICQPKFSDNDLPFIKGDQILFGWLHLVEREKNSKELIRKGITAIAWEFMYRGKDYVFKDNRILTGEVGALHSITYSKKMPRDCTVALIGSGMVGQGALNILKKLDAHVIIYDIKLNNMNKLKKEISNYDVIMHCVGAYPKIILSKNDLSKMKEGALFVHMGDDCIEGMPKPMSIYNPVSTINNKKNTVYRINHLPTIAYKTASSIISKDVVPYINKLINNEIDITLKNAVVIDRGIPLKERLWSKEYPNYFPQK